MQAGCNLTDDLLIISGNGTLYMNTGTLRACFLR